MKQSLVNGLATLAVGPRTIQKRISISRMLAPCLGMVAFALCVGQAYAQPDRTLRPNFGTATLKAGFRPDPFVKNLTAGGTVATKLGGVSAHVSRAPDFQLFYTAGGHSLRIFVESQGDTTLLVNLPNGSWVANDDGGVGANPQLNFAKPQSGRYDIWVGTFRPQVVAATLKISEMGGSPSGAGLRVDMQVLNKQENLFNSPRLFSELEEEWNRRRGEIDGELQHLLATLNPKLPRGVNFVRQKSTVSTAKITTSIGRAAGFSPVKLMEINLQIDNNSMRTRLTQPSPLGSYADPEFLVTYNIRGTVYIPVSDNTKRLAVSGAKFEVQNINIDPRNNTARLLSLFDRAFLNAHYTKQVEQMLSKKINLAPIVNKQLEPVNSRLAAIPGDLRVELRPGFVINLTATPKVAVKDDLVVK